MELNTLADSICRNQSILDSQAIPDLVYEFIGLVFASGEIFDEAETHISVCMGDSANTR